MSTSSINVNGAIKRPENAISRQVAVKRCHDLSRDAATVSGSASCPRLISQQQNGTNYSKDWMSQMEDTRVEYSLV